MRKLLAATAIVGALVAFPAAAWAHDCANVSRPQGQATPFQEKGKWQYLPEQVVGLEGGIWVFDNPSGFGGNSGHEHVLLSGTGACSAARLDGQTQGTLDPNDAKGIWGQECFADAGGTLP